MAIQSNWIEFSCWYLIARNLVHRSGRTMSRTMYLQTISVLWLLVSFVLNNGLDDERRMSFEPVHKLGSWRGEISGPRGNWTVNSILAAISIGCVCGIYILFFRLNLLTSSTDYNYWKNEINFTVCWCGLTMNWLRRTAAGSRETNLLALTWTADGGTGGWDWDRLDDGRSCACCPDICNTVGEGEHPTMAGSSSLKTGWYGSSMRILPHRWKNKATAATQTAKTSIKYFNIPSSISNQYPPPPTLFRLFLTRWGSYYVLNRDNVKE